MHSLDGIKGLNDFAARGAAAQRAVNAEIAKATPKTKPTTDSSRPAFQSAISLATNALSAAEHLYAAKRLFESDATRNSVTELEHARDCLVTLRRTQTAAIENIDAALKSAKEGL